MKTPTLEEVKKYFENAETVKDYMNDIGTVELENFEQGITGDVFQNPFEKNWLVLFHKKHGYAEILTYKKTKKSEMKKEFTITKEQIKSLYMGGGNGGKLKEWFPKAFEKELVVGKWYSYRSFSPNFLFKFNGFFDKDQYGFNASGNFDYTLGIRTSEADDYDLATHQEIEIALISEAKHRGFVKGAYINRGQELLKKHNTALAPKTIKLESNRYYYDTDEDYFTIDGRVVFIQGLWAEIKEHDYDAEIEALQQKAKLDGMKAVVTFEKL